MGLFGLNKELQFRVCSDGELRTSPYTARRRELFSKGERKLGGLEETKSPLEELRVQSIVAFHWLSCGSLSLVELLPSKRRKSFFFLLDSAIV